MLVVLSEWGYWGEELVDPLEVFDEKGYEVDFMTPCGNRPRALPVSMEVDFLDPPLDRQVTTKYYANLTREVDSSTRLDKPISLAAWFPERPYFSSKTYLRESEKYNNALAQSMGVPGVRIERLEQTAPASQRALAHEGPFLIDLVIMNEVPGAESNGQRE